MGQCCPNSGKGWTGSYSETFGAVCVGLLLFQGWLSSHQLKAYRGALCACLEDMQIQINTDKNIEGNEAFADHVRTVVEKNLDHYADRLSRVEVHLGDMNAEKTGQQDQICTMEARPNGMEPVAATHKAANSHAAVEGAAHSLANLLRTRFGKLDDHKGAAALPFQKGEG